MIHEIVVIGLKVVATLSDLMLALGVIFYGNQFGEIIPAGYIFITGLVALTLFGVWIH